MRADQQNLKLQQQCRVRVVTLAVLQLKQQFSIWLAICRSSVFSQYNT